MEHKTYDAWTRRRFAAAGGLSVLLGLGVVERGTAKKKRGAKAKP